MAWSRACSQGASRAERVAAAGEAACLEPAGDAPASVLVATPALQRLPVDRVLSPEASLQDVFDVCGAGAVQHFLQGGNACLLACGSADAARCLGLDGACRAQTPPPCSCCRAPA